VLIVEDDADTAELLTEQLESDALEIAIARNGQQAILKTGEYPPDVVIMDYMMPMLDGFETTRFLKAKFQQFFIPVMMLTAKDDPASKAKGARYGCDDYLTKPYKRKALLGVLEEMIAMGQLERELQAAAIADGSEASGEVPTPERVTEASQALVELRLTIAERQIQNGFGAIAQRHLNRVSEIDPDNAKAKALGAKI
jgi:DNA-binding response OmpR family regulator